MKLFSSKRRLGIAAFILLALFLVRPGASRLKSRIILSMSAALGRPVDIGAVHIQLLPRPGFDLDNLVVYDDPRFGAEPMLRAAEVTAALRLTSLLRGRLEIARLVLNEPSLNLVHGESGHWNIESLLERTARLPLAPTSKNKSEPRPGFPYIEGTSGRINFKNGTEKRPYALTNADFALWQESENSWAARLKAQPFRSDMNLNDIGGLQISGTWQRADVTTNTPLQVSLEWSHAQVGQVTKFVTGIDQGWRGTVLLDVTFKGTPAKLQISGNAAVEDFRRYDITSGQALRMSAQCDAEYSSITHEFRQGNCSAPVGKGLLALTGDMGWPGSRLYSLLVTAEKVPAKALLMLAQRVKKNLPEDLAAEGTVHGTLSIREGGAFGTPAHWQGRGEIAEFRLRSAANKAEIGPETVPFVVAGGRAGTRGDGRAGYPTNAHLELGPFTLGTGHGQNPEVRGWIARAGYSFSVTGDCDVARTLRLGRMLGLPTTAATADGLAKLNLTVAGKWRQGSREEGGFTGPQIVGLVKLKNVRIAARGLSAPVEISSADVQLASDRVRVEHLTAKAASTTWNGSVQLPRGCAGSAVCPVQFALRANQLSLSELKEWIGSSQKKRPWYRVLETGTEANASVLASLEGSGRITADRFQVQRVQATHVSAEVRLDHGKVEIAGLTADLLDGRLSGEWKLDLESKPSVCRGSGNITGVSLASLAGLMNDGWVDGTGNANYEIASTCSGDFWRSAQATVRVDVRNGTLPHLSISDDEQPVRMTRLSGEGQLRAGKVEIKDAKLISPAGTYHINGTASLNRQVDLKFEAVSNRAATSYAITGTLSEPRVAPLASPMQARLK